MKHAWLYLFLVLLCCKTYSQINLVPNFSFENYTTCPSGEDEINYSTGWSKYSAANTTPDYYNSCAPSNGFGVPKSIIGNQLDHRNCNSYSGVITIATSPSNYREQIGIQLNQVLVIGQKYFISFYTVMGEDNIVGNQFGMPSNNIGLLLSTVAYNPINPAPINNFAHLRSIAIISDSTNWVRISGSILADSAYNYLIIGNFYDDSNSDTIHYNCGSCFNAESYYFVDDVCVSTDSLLCNGGIDAFPCNVSINENNIKNQISIYPNPANDYINICNENSQAPLNIAITNIVGQQLYAKQYTNCENVRIDIDHYSTGLLFIKIESNNQYFIYKLLKQ